MIRREPGVTPERLARRLQGGLQEYAGHLPAAERQLRLKVSGLEGTPLGQGVSLSLPWVLGTSVLLTLLIACANVAILVIAQWTAREEDGDSGVARGEPRPHRARARHRAAAHRGHRRPARHQHDVALLGVIVHNAGESVRFFDLSIDSAILIDSVVITLVTGVVSGIGPALLADARGAAGGSGNVFDPDWPAFAVPVAVILVIGALATWIPSRRALTINPAILSRTT